MKRVTIIGGGLGGLIVAIQFARAGVACVVVEKKNYPFHRVCGEYISNEVVPFLQSQRLYPAQCNPPQIRRFQLSSIDGKYKTMPLDLGGFGISRYTFDNFLYEEAIKCGVVFYLNEEVTSVVFHQSTFTIKSPLREWESEIVIGAFGKRSRLDHSLGRSFIKQRSPYVGVKYHIRTNNPDDLIALHNFPGGYCGMSNIEDGKTTLCYLSHRDNFKGTRGVREMEEQILFQNPILKNVFTHAEFLFDKPEVINEISFVTKNAVEDHILMIGDAAGMIAPLCGNGMAMAIRSAKLVADEVLLFLKPDGIGRADLEKRYTEAWTKAFSGRLWRGRQVQRLFGKEVTSRVCVSLVMNIPPLARMIVQSTHGEVF